MTASERLAFARQLESALAARKPVQDIARLVRSVLVAQRAPNDGGGQSIIRTVAERMEAHVATGRTVVDVATDMQKLLAHATSDETVELLAELMIGRERMLATARQYFAGTLRRTSFLSFVAEQPWPDVVRQRVSTMPDAELRVLTVALERHDVPTLERAMREAQ